MPVLPPQEVEQQGCGCFLHEWGSLECGGSLHSCVTLFRQIKQDDFANVPTSKGHLSSLYSQLMAKIDSIAEAMAKCTVEPPVIVLRWGNGLTVPIIPSGQPLPLFSIFPD